LKILLIEWMRRNNGSNGFFTNPRYNFGTNRGAVFEIKKRRTWQTVDYWDSHWKIYFGRPVKARNGEFRRNEYLYIGRTSPGMLRIDSITFSGPDAKYFRADRNRANIKKGGHIRVKISFHSRRVIWDKGLHAYLEIKNNANGVRRIRLFGGRIRY